MLVLLRKRAVRDLRRDLSLVSSSGIDVPQYLKKAWGAGCALAHRLRQQSPVREHTVEELARHLLDLSCLYSGSLVHRLVERGEERNDHEQSCIYQDSWSDAECLEQDSGNH